MSPGPPLIDSACWIVVADEAGAVFYSREKKHAALHELFSMDNAQARDKTGALISDRDGRSFDSHGHGRHAMTKEKVDPKRQIAIRFAKEIAERIARAMHKGDCRRLALIAAPRFLGVLRPALVTKGVAEPFLTIDKEVVGNDVCAIEKLLTEYSNRG